MIEGKYLAICAVWICVGLVGFGGREDVGAVAFWGVIATLVLLR